MSKQIKETEKVIDRASPEYVIEFQGVEKRFGEVIANKGVSFGVKKGEILSLLGENGSGKTTLMNMLSGIYFPDAGKILINGEEAVIRSPKDAFKYKIGMIHQHFKLVDVFTAAENIVLGVDRNTFDRESAIKGLTKRFKDGFFTVNDIESYLTVDEKYFDGSELNKIIRQVKHEVKQVAKATCTKVSDLDNNISGIELKKLLVNNFSAANLIVNNLDEIINKEEYDVKTSKTVIKQIVRNAKFKTFHDRFSKKNINARVEKLSKRYGFDVDPKKRVHEMSVSEKQTVEIVKVLYRGADILILDEPTAVLTPQEIKKLFNILKVMREYGKSVIIITHKLNEVMEISDRVSVLRKGEYIGTVNTSETNEKALTEMMVGKKVDLRIERVKTDFDKPLLELRDLKIKGDDGSVKIEDVNFYIRGGEILGVAGVAGCGQKELCEAIAGLRKLENGLIMHKGENIIGLSTKEIIEKGIAMSFIPEDRLGMGLAPSFSITDNMMIKTYSQGRGPFVNRKEARERAKALIEKLEIVTPSTETPVRRLSGGNVQKVLVGREIEAGPNVIVTAYPVRGLDINSSYAIYDILNEEKKKGTGILFIGEDLDVMLALCDKIMVLCHGKNMGIVHAEKTTKEQLGLMMTGSLDLNMEKKDKNFGIAKDSNLTEAEWKEAEQQVKAEGTKEGKND